MEKYLGKTGSDGLRGALLMVEVAGVVPSEGTERQDRSAPQNRTSVLRRRSQIQKKPARCRL